MPISIQDLIKAVEKATCKIGPVQVHKGDELVTSIGFIEVINASELLAELRKMEE